MDTMEESGSSAEDWCDIINSSNKTGPFCVKLETSGFYIGNHHIRIDDLIILGCNLIFLIFLLIRIVPTIRKLIKSWSTWPLFTILYWEIFCIPLFCCLHEAVSISFDHGSIAAKITHYVLRGSILITEISIVVFGLTFKKYQGRKRTLFATMIVVLVLCICFTTLEGVLDMMYKHRLACDHHKLFTHGGMIFSFITSSILSLAYLTTFLLYLCNLHTRWDLPSKKSFYRYALFLSIVNIVQAIGSMLWYEGLKHRVMGNIGICMTMITSDIYLITFPPVVYWIFLRNYFRMNTSSGRSRSSSRIRTNTGSNDTPSPRRWWSRMSLSPRPGSNPLPIYKQILRDESTHLLHDESVSSVADIGSYMSAGVTSNKSINNNDDA